MTDAVTSQYSIDNVYKAFSSVIDRLDNKSIHLHQFVLAFRELSKFFDHLNVVFSFIAYDLAEKFHLLDHLYKSNPIDYKTVQKLIAYEKSKDDKTGTIALLRLLRALEFIYLFLERAIVSSTGSASTKHIAWDIYKQTLHRRHGKPIRLSVWLATTTIPKRETLRQTLLRGEIEPNTADKCFPLIEAIYRDIYRLYEENNLLELVPL